MKDIKTDSINELLDHYINELGVDKDKAEINISFNGASAEHSNCWGVWEWIESEQRWIRVADCG